MVELRGLVADGTSQNISKNTADMNSNNGQT